MMEESFSDLTVVDDFFRRGSPFAVYRIPGEEHVHLLVQTVRSTCRIMNRVEELNGLRGFVIAPFCPNSVTPVVLIEPDRRESILWDESDRMTVEECQKERNSFLHFSSQLPIDTYTDAYANCFQRFSYALKRKDFEKLVLSRSVSLARPENFSPIAAFRMACRCYVYSYVFLCYTPQTGIWLGSTPEIILSGKEEEWKTVALAGTQPLQDGQLPKHWDEKNRMEQAYVASYIRNCLSSMEIKAIESEPYPTYAGALSHLKSDFCFSLTDRGMLGSLLSSLHPTPAVCGLPKEKAYQFILENEGYDRNYYSGFVGWLDPDGNTDLYVNLRCMHVGKDRLTLYAGGGLLASSRLEDEWLETEKKMQTMKGIL